MLNFDYRANDVEERRNKPEDIVDVVTVVIEFLAVLPKAYIVKVEGMISEEVDNECQVAENAVEDCSLRSHFVQS